MDYSEKKDTWIPHILSPDKAIWICQQKEEKQRFLLISSFLSFKFQKVYIKTPGKTIRGILEFSILENLKENLSLVFKVSAKGFTMLMEANQEHSTIFVPSLLKWNDILTDEEWNFQSITNPLPVNAEKSHLD